MNKYQKGSLQAFRKVRGFIAAHPELTSAPQTRPQLVPAGGQQSATVSGTSPAGVAKQVAAFNAAVDQVTAAAAEQDLADRNARAAVREAEAAKAALLTAHVRHVAIIAKAVIPAEAPMAAKLRQPRRRDAEAVLATADAMAQAATIHRDALVSRGLAPDFVEQMNQAAAAYRGAIDAKGAAIGRRRNATSALYLATRRGIASLNALSVLVERRYAGNQDLLAEWQQLRRVVQFPTASKVEASAAQAGSSSGAAAAPGVKAAAA